MEALAALVVWSLGLLGAGLDAGVFTFRSYLPLPLRPVAFVLGLALLRWTVVTGAIWFFSTFLRRMRLEITGDRLVPHDPAGHP
jgi:hypothetical protein